MPPRRKSPRKPKGKKREKEASPSPEPQPQEEILIRIGEPLSPDDDHETLEVEADVHVQHQPRVQQQQPRVQQQQQQQQERQPRREKRPAREPDEDEEIATLKLILDFFEAHPEYYDLGHILYKDEKRKDLQLDGLAETLGPEWTGE